MTSSNLDYLAGMPEEKYVKSHLRRAIRECHAIARTVSASDIAIKAAGNMANGRRGMQIPFEKLATLAGDLLKGRWR